MKDHFNLKKVFILKRLGNAVPSKSGRNLQSMFSRCEYFRWVFV